MADRGKNIMWGVAGVIITGIAVSAWEVIRPMTKAEHDADINQFSSIAEDVDEISRQWKCYNNGVAIDQIIAEQEPTPMDQEMLRRLRARRDALDCKSL
jgi:hypothetical protein